MYKAVIFDAYGTLISTGSGSIDASKKILKKNGSLIDPIVFYSEWKKYHREHIDSLTDFIKEEEIFLQDLFRLYEKYSIKGNPEEDSQIMISKLGNRMVFEDVIEVMETLRRRFKLFIGSTSDEKPLNSDIKTNNVYVDGIFTSESLRVYKPQKEFYQKILSAINMTAKEVIYVGDSLLDDVYGPSLLGINSIWINRKKQINTDIKYKPMYEIESLSELLSFFNTL